ncbi:PREDICTED: protein trichome birefringence-like 12 [Tarenaya hassleriana]|uniref:protein trichome birefringence-like 12 n=1 Tax=Tarenaya hassleriana TaxID=28532 RepID=UPI00053C1FEB|nr:PREDICTED: protein trichome birefringence-like 12 [Tarenaya hassleriana]
MAPKLRFLLLPRLMFLSFLLLLLYSVLLRRPTTSPPASSPPCDLFSGRWVFQPDNPKPLYDETCPFHRNAWNCIRNKRENMGRLNSWRWVPNGCGLSRIDPARFLGLIRNMNIGFVGDSLNENFLVSFLCILKVADPGAKKWKKKKAWRGAYFPKFNVTVAYHRAVLLAKYQWQPKPFADTVQDGVKGIYRVDVDTPADDWVNITSFYDVLIFNTGHWWGYDKFPKETMPLVFYSKGRPIDPPLEISQGFEVVLEHMVSHIQRKVPAKTLKFWRLQSPRHFYGGEWNQNGSCLFDKPLDENELDLWFDPSNNGVNKEARRLNHFIKNALQGTNIKLLDLTRLSEFRADAHPAIWLGKQDAVAIWGQDCMHWCLPGVPDTWVDILAKLILNDLGTE